MAGETTIQNVKSIAQKVFDYVNDVIKVNSISVPTGRYSAFISVRQSATTAAGAVIWSMRNDPAATKDAFIDQIQIQMSFDTTTPLARSTPRYGIVRFDTATPTGGTAITPVRFDNTDAAPQVSDIRTASGGLTTTGVVLDETFAFPGVPAVDGSVMNFPFKDLGLKLAPGEGLLVNLLTTAVIGQYIGGIIVWSER